MRNTAIMAAVLVASVAVAAPQLTVKTDSNYQQTQALASLSIQQGAGCEVRLEVKTGNTWATLSNLTARLEARSNATATATYQANSTVTDTTNKYFKIPLVATNFTGTALTNWQFAAIILEGGTRYVMGTGRVDIVASEWAGSGSTVLDGHTIVISNHTWSGTFPTSAIPVHSQTASTITDGNTTWDAYGSAAAVSNALAAGAAAGATAVQPATLSLHTTNTLANVHGGELDPIWTAASNTVTTGAASGATAVQPATLTLHTTNTLNPHAVTLQQAANAGNTVSNATVALEQLIIRAVGDDHIQLTGGSISERDQGGSIRWDSMNETKSGHTFVNYDNRLVFSPNGQSSESDTGVAWVDFDDGSASFGGGGLTILSTGVLGGTGVATWLAALTTAINMRSDSVGVTYGAAGDASTIFDGDSLNITANAVTGTDGLELNAGYVKLTGGIDVKPTADSTAAFNVTTSNGTDVVVVDTTNRRVGIGGAPGGYALNVSSGAASISGGGLDVTGGNGIYCNKRMLVNGTGGHYLAGSGTTIGSTAAVTAGMALDVVGNARVATNLTVAGLSYIILPTATNGLSAGMLWNNAGTVSVMP